MHYCCFVIGDDPERQLERFSDYFPVEPAKVYIDAEELRHMAEYHRVSSVDDLPALLPYARKWYGHSVTGEGVGLDEGGIYWWDESNPGGKFDWCAIGGRFDGMLPVRAAGGGSRRANQARRGEVDEDDLFADPPAALLVNGAWHEVDLGADEAERVAWAARFAALMRTVPPDALVTVVDLHS